MSAAGRFQTIPRGVIDILFDVGRNGAARLLDGIVKESRVEMCQAAHTVRVIAVCQTSLDGCSARSRDASPGFQIEATRFTVRARSVQRSVVSGRQHRTSLFRPQRVASNMHMRAAAKQIRARVADYRDRPCVRSSRPAGGWLPRRSSATPVERRWAGSRNSTHTVPRARAARSG